jgi:biopolymer transport protein ExbB
MYNIYHFLFIKGGPVMYPIILGSIVALALFLEKLWVLRKERVIPRGLQSRIRAMVREKKISEAEVLCQENASSLAAIFYSGLREAGRERAEIKETINDVGRREVARLEERVDLLGTIAAIEPLMGLLGTVTGLIRAFQQVETFAGRGVGVNPGALASGIWEALITTAAGLIIGIPAYLGYRYLQGHINSLAVELEEDSMEIGNLIARTTSVHANEPSPTAVGSEP